MQTTQLNELIGKRLKEMRMKKGLSLDNVAELTGVSKPMLGQIERARSNPTVSTLWKIAEGLNVPFTAFLEDKKSEVNIVKETELTPIKENDEQFEVFPVFPMAGGKPFEIYKVTLLPGCHYQAAAHPTGVEEYLWLYSGTIRIRIGDETYAIREKEGIQFSADQSHLYMNSGKATASLVMVIYYPL
ncbi:transcriptional regulator [Pullulanibacillus camelliae]|uniref:Transcriptional regulator n=1 Tax=Pullulanibacillus camelliae TaxID=1707096 RepID=A0A8J2YKQ1_9BACL|nr:XRE family transcriptional regulator [Pullulanibacillus camelliae]GGE49789.1 transcriptional regulator [Pullulanibacillus camelliae]